MTTSISSETMWNFKKYVWNWQNKEIKYQLRNKCFCMFTFLPFVAWLTDWYGKQKVGKENIKIKENKNHETFQQLVNTFTFKSFVA